MTRAHFLIACAAAIALIAAAYSSSFDNSFHFDDAHVIETNAYLRSLDNVPRFFTDPYTFSSLPQNATYRPLVTLSLALDWAAGGGSPRPFHVTQIALLLILGAMLAAFFTPILGRWQALFGATLFCVHTANTETMNLISARSELLSTIGLLAAFLLYQRSAFARRTLLYLVPLAIGALAKAPLVVFAPLLFLYAIVIGKEPARRALRTALPSLVLGIALLAFLNSMNAKEWTSGGGAAWSYVITQPFVWLHYARLFVLPIGLTADTDWQPFAHWYDTRAVAGYAFVALLVFAIRRYARSQTKGAAALGLAWFAIALLPTSLFPLAEVANEHRLFFAYIGLVLAAAALVDWRVLAVACVVFAIGTHERNEVWRTEETLWADVVQKSPGNGRAWMNYGLTQMAKGQYPDAKRNFERALALAPSYSYVEINLGIVEGQLGDQVAAERHFRRALELNPDHNAHFFYARWLVQRGRTAEAIPHLREAQRLSPGFTDARALLERLQ
ncbi:MAG TPA: tetratricopeptide repeat protein [Thermoanaerobaculia bacterium]|nr:tetratricopeptide repeat protein [Thermoanaerobaculia bacterium]